MAAAEPQEAVTLCWPLLLGPTFSGGTEGALLKRPSALCRLGCAGVQADAPAADLVSVLTLQQPAGFPLKRREEIVNQGLEHMPGNSSLPAPLCLELLSLSHVSVTVGV